MLLNLLNNSEMFDDIMIKAINWISKLHKIDLDISEYFNQRVYESIAMKYEVDKFIKNVLPKITETDKKALLLKFNTIIEKITKNTLTCIIHRDFQSCNIMYYKYDTYFINFLHFACILSARVNINSNFFCLKDLSHTETPRTPRKKAFSWVKLKIQNS